jgi:Tfp pilus assembly protein PilO
MAYSSHALSEALRPFLRSIVNLGPLRGALLSLLISGALLYAGYSYYISPAVDENKLKEQQLIELQAQNRANRTTEETLPQLLSEMRRATDVYANARVLLPDEPEVSIVLQSIQRLARVRGVTILRFKDTGPGTKSKIADKLNERVVPVTVIGRHQDIVMFLADIATYPRILHVRDFAIKSSSKSETLDFNLISYYAPSPKDLPRLPDEINEDQPAPVR